MSQTKIINWINYVLIGGATIFFAIRLYNLIKRQAVNILFFDQWDFLIPLFSNPTSWEMFTYQHGPHRQGLGLFVSSLIGQATNWNTRAECFGMGIILVLVTLGAFLLKWRLFGKLTAWDMLIPSITLSFMQLESIVLTPNPAHGALPILLVIISGLILTLNNFYIRYFGLAFVTFLAIYTGFGFFLGLIAPMIFAFSCISHWLKKEKKQMIVGGTSFVISIVSFASFFIGYTYSPVQDCFQSPLTNPLNYLSFIGLQLSMFLGFHSLQNAGIAQILGIILFFALIGAAFKQIWQLLKKCEFESNSIIIFMMVAFSLLFVLNSTSGRICGGLGGAQSSRYMTLLIPGILGLYFAVQDSFEKYFLIIVNIILIILFIILPIPQMKEFAEAMNNFTNVKKAWAVCYVERENIEDCNKIAGNVVYPNPAATRMKEKLDLLKEKKYNLFIEK